MRSCGGKSRKKLSSFARLELLTEFNRTENLFFNIDGYSVFRLTLLNVSLEIIVKRHNWFELVT